jgi:hypothetical protein
VDAAVRTARTDARRSMDLWSIPAPGLSAAPGLGFDTELTSHS